MGNRCAITTYDNYIHNGVGVYLHWNGGRDSVEAFLEYMRLRKFRSPKEDESYAWARLCQVIGNYFGGGLSIGVDTVNRLDTDGDNGTYLIDDWSIVGRENFEGHTEQDEYDLNDMLLDIDSCQPVGEQLGKEFLSAKEVQTSDLRIGDEVFVMDIDDKYRPFTVVGIGERGHIVNGTRVTGIPYIDKYGNCKSNINCYLLEERYRVFRRADNETEPDYDLLF